MKVDWTKWSAIAEILSAVAIVVTLLYLANQTALLNEQNEQNNELLQQNNELLSAQARATRVGLRQADTTLVLENPQLAETILKHQNDEPLTDYEALILDGYMNFILVNFQTVYREWKFGLIDFETIPLNSWRPGFSAESNDDRYLDMRSYWERFAHSDFDPDFVAWMEENVINYR